MWLLWWYKKMHVPNYLVAIAVVGNSLSDKLREVWHMKIVVFNPSTLLHQTLQCQPQPILAWHMSQIRRIKFFYFDFLEVFELIQW